MPLGDDALPTDGTPAALIRAVTRSWSDVWGSAVRFLQPLGHVVAGQGRNTSANGGDDGPGGEEIVLRPDAEVADGVGELSNSMIGAAERLGICGRTAHRAQHLRHRLKS